MGIFISPLCISPRPECISPRATAGDMKIPLGVLRSFNIYIAHAFNINYCQIMFDHGQSIKNMFVIVSFALYLQTLR